MESVFGIKSLDKKAGESRNLNVEDENEFVKLMNDKWIPDAVCNSELNFEEWSNATLARKMP